MSGHREYLIGRRDAVLSTCRVPPTARARIMGERPAYQPIVETPKQAVAAVLPAARPAPLSLIQPRIPVPSRLTVTGRYGRSYGGKPVPDHAGTSAKVRDIITVFADVFGVEIELLLSSERRKKYARPRQAAMYLMAKHLRLSQTTIGEIFKRDHTTVTSSVAKITQLLAEDRSFQCRYEFATHQLRQLWAVP